MKHKNPKLLFITSIVALHIGSAPSVGYAHELTNQLIQKAQKVKIAHDLSIKEFEAFTNLLKSKCKSGNPIYCTAMGAIDKKTFIPNISRNKIKDLSNLQNYHNQSKEYCKTYNSLFHCYLVGLDFWIYAENKTTSQISELTLRDFLSELKQKDKKGKAYFDVKTSSNRFLMSKISNSDVKKLEKDCAGGSHIACILFGANWMHSAVKKFASLPKIESDAHNVSANIIDSECKTLTTICGKAIAQRELSGKFNPEQATQAYKKLCSEKNDAFSCRNAAIGLENVGIKNEETLRMLELGCEGGHLEACNLAYSRLKLRGEAIKSFETAVLGCQNEGDGEGFPILNDLAFESPNLKEGEALATYGCNLKINSSCETLARIQFKQGKLAESRRQLGILCDEGDLGSCRFLAQVFWKLKNYVH